MAEQTFVNRLLIASVVGLGVALGVWLAMGLSGESSDTGSEVPGALADDPGPPPDEPAPATDYSIDEGGRLSLDASSLPDGESLTFGLALAAEARGDEPLPAVVVSAEDGRRLELLAIPVAESESGLRLEVDADWLKPGRYMVQIKTTEKILPLRRYVIEVHGAAR